MPQPQLFLTDTLSGARRAFVPGDPRRVTMYVCGPTVYDYAHIGNARAAVVFDQLFRLLRRLYGPDQVVYARNITDIDDKIIARAGETGEPIGALTERFARIYRDDMSALGVLAPTLEPHATAHVADMLALIAALETKGHAYAAASGAWFSVDSMPDYGQLSKRALEDLIAGARVEAAADKRHPGDFALWKAAKPGEPAWESPYGPGRPGWHIECSAMIRALLGDTIDIHGGGHDLIFPHHENERAQSECAHGAPLARYWLHNGFLTMDAEKMSKSLGNVKLVHELVQHWPGEAVRLALLSGHYRAPLDWTDASLEQAKAGLDRLYRAFQRLKAVTPAPAEGAGAVLAALCDDLNTPEALAALFALATEANKAEEPADQARLKTALLEAGDLLGLLQTDPDQWFRGGDDAEAAEIDALVAARVAARAAKNWAEADRLREALSERGVEVMDGPAGSTWRKVG